MGLRKPQNERKTHDGTIGILVMLDVTDSRLANVAAGPIRNSLDKVGSHWGLLAKLLAAIARPSTALDVPNNMKTTGLQLSRTGVALAAAFLYLMPASSPSADAPAEPRDLCRMLGGRSDRTFAGRPGNLYAVVGAKARLIYMAGELSLKSGLLQGKVVEWRPDYVQLQPPVLVGVDGAAAEGIAAEKYCWIGPTDTLLTEHVLRNSTTNERTVRLSFDLRGVAEVKSLEGKVTFLVSGGYPQAVVPRLFGALSATQPVPVSEGKMQVDVSVPAGKTVSCVLALAIGADAGKVAQAAGLSADPRGESTHYWNRMLTTEIPTFTCSDPYLEKLYYFRWWSLLTKMNVGGYGHWSQPLAREGTVGFNALISYSGSPSTIDLRWMRSPEWAYGNIQSFYDNLHDGKLANHIYPDTLDGDNANHAPGRNGLPTDFPYHNFLVKALTDVYALHPDAAMLRRLWPTLQQATGLYDRELDADHDGLYETYPWSNITGQEWSARFLYFHPYDQLLSYDRTWH